MTRPAGSSAARLMRSPELSFSMDLLIRCVLSQRLRCAFWAMMLLLMRVRDMSQVLLDLDPTAVMAHRVLPTASLLQAVIVCRLGSRGRLSPARPLHPPMPGHLQRGGLHSHYRQLYSKAKRPHVRLQPVWTFVTRPAGVRTASIYQGPRCGKRGGRLPAAPPEAQ